MHELMIAELFVNFNGTIKLYMRPNNVYVLTT